MEKSTHTKKYGHIMRVHQHEFNMNTTNDEKNLKVAWCFLNLGIESSIHVDEPELYHRIS